MTKLWLAVVAAVAVGCVGASAEEPGGEGGRATGVAPEAITIPCDRGVCKIAGSYGTCTTDQDCAPCGGCFAPFPGPCVAGTTAALCGKGGALCNVCLSGSCVDGACGP